MNITDRIKIQLMIKRFSYKELETIKKFIDEEYKRRRRNILEHK